MANYKWPDVYPTIKDLSGVVATNSVTSCAYVGEAEFGPINKPTFLASLRDYTSTFGALNSAKYGYAGYSLAVASESIDSHYFVRVVKAGKAGEHASDDAMYGSVYVPSSTSSKTPIAKGWYVEEIDAVETKEDASGLFANQYYRLNTIEMANDNTGTGAVDDEITITIADKTKTPATVKVTAVDANEKITAVEIINAGEFTQAITGDVLADAAAEHATINTSIAKFTVTSINTNVDDALIVVANNPNDLKLSVEIIDSTINENRAYAYNQISYVAGTPTDTNWVYTATMTDVNDNILYVDPAAAILEPLLKVGDLVEVTVRDYVEQSGIYEVESISGKTITYTYTVAKTTQEIEEHATTAPIITPSDNGKIKIYPAANERTFQVNIRQIIGRVSTIVESYEYCTLYQAKDNFGNSMFVEDVINNYSDYVKVYVNPYLLASLEEGEVLQPKFIEPNMIGGGKSGGRPSLDEVQNGWKLFNDRTQTNVSLLLNSGYTTSTGANYQQAMLAVAEKRRDCFCLFDIPVSEVEYDNAIDWRRNTLGMNSYRCAVSSPWVKTYDSVQGRANFVMCPSAFVAKLIGQAGDPWNAPAGPNRGIIGSATVSPTGLTQSYDAEVGGMLYADNQINCIVKDTAAGYVNWGQRTLQQKPSALDRINVARTVIYIETILRDAARWHLFQNNTPYERMQITLQFSAFLDTILSAEGISAYRVICDNTNNTPIVIQNNQLVIDVLLWPVYAAEVILLNTTIEGADASVTVSSSAS